MKKKACEKNDKEGVHEGNKCLPTLDNVPLHLEKVLGRWRVEMRNRVGIENKKKTEWVGDDGLIFL